MKKNAENKNHNFKKSKINGTKVVVKDSSKEAVESAIYSFKKLVKDSGKLNELRDRQEYSKPSKTRRKILQYAVRRQKRLTEYEKYIDSLSYN
ncbi:MAG: 30S ribosomal protein S21 [Bacteroidetes bacterium]|nr:30S ribosomal protein S21 [Bacteroidota bacterium]